jgi:hypothetical protein
MLATMTLGTRSDLILKKHLALPSPKNHLNTLVMRIKAFIYSLLREREQES